MSAGAVRRDDRPSSILQPEVAGMNADASQPETTSPFVTVPPRRDVDARKAHAACFWLDSGTLLRRMETRATRDGRSVSNGFDAREPIGQPGVSRPQRSHFRNSREGARRTKSS
jgi:hypothetical protein